MHVSLACDSATHPRWVCFVGFHVNKEALFTPIALIQDSRDKIALCYSPIHIHSLIEQE